MVDTVRLADNDKSLLDPPVQVIIFRNNRPACSIHATNEPAAGVEIVGCEV